jgi:glycogen operon protein
MHVDGFRFDLASVLTRGENGEPLASPPLLGEIANDPLLSRAKLIAEPWDAGGLYQVGFFAKYGFAEWNDRFRDDVRRFVRGDSGSAADLGARITGSRDLFGAHDDEWSRTINFVACHDGFTLADLVSYNEKHNEANGEDNRDGANENCSWNCGVEGPSDDRDVEELRRRQLRNLLTILFVSRGIPMLGMGDEVRRSQDGNNNTYCQNNELSWFDWSALDEQQDLLRFVRGLIRLARTSEVLASDLPWDAPEGGSDEARSRTGTRVRWHGVQQGEPDWEGHSQSVAFSLESARSGQSLHVLLNAHKEPLPFELPAPPAGAAWKRLVDTSLAPPEDFRGETEAPAVTTPTYTAKGRSCVVLLARAEPPAPVS